MGRFNEECFFFALILLFLFSDFVPTPALKYDIGWAFLSIIFLCLSLNLGNMVKGMVMELIKFVKKKISERREKKLKKLMEKKPFQPQSKL